jgi:hypothetical protein
MTKETSFPKATVPSDGKVYGYARVSTLMQADEGQSLDVQARVIAAESGHKLSHVGVRGVIVAAERRHYAAAELKEAA